MGGRPGSAAKGGLSPEVRCTRVGGYERICVHAVPHSRLRLPMVLTLEHEISHSWFVVVSTSTETELPEFDRSATEIAQAVAGKFPVVLVRFTQAKGLSVGLRRRMPT
ncbi:hypothetical protein PL81_01095 [Streptomyces sp. RSD-27]|nr:hypothetical protein PL81_01095 [Streptomyces sp. RSD-27]